MRNIMRGGLVIAAATLALGVAGPAFADPSGVASNPGSPNSGSSNNCIATFSSGSTHNGQAPTLGQGGDPSHGTRGDEIKGLQATCGAQS